MIVSMKQVQNFVVKYEDEYVGTFRFVEEWNGLTRYDLIELAEGKRDKYGQIQKPEGHMVVRGVRGIYGAPPSAEVVSLSQTVSDLMNNAQRRYEERNRPDEEKKDTA